MKKKTVCLFIYFASKSIQLKNSQLIQNTKKNYNKNSARFLLYIKNRFKPLIKMCELCKKKLDITDV